MIEIAVLFISIIWILGVVVTTGIIAIPFAVAGLLLAPLIFIYLLMLASVLYLFEIHFLLGIFAMLGYMYLLHVLNLKERLQGKRRTKKRPVTLNQTK